MKANQNKAEMLASRLWPVIRAVGLGWLALGVARAAAGDTPTTAPAESMQLQSMAEAAPININVGQSVLLKAPWPVKTVTVADQKVADIQQAVDLKNFVVQGKAIGTTDLMFLGENGNAERAHVVVTADFDAVRGALKNLLPGANLNIHMSNDVLIVSGTLRRAEESDILHRYLETTVPNKFVDATTLAGPQQVSIKVTLAEANRTAVRALGINAFEVGTEATGGFQVGSSTGGALNPAGSIGLPNSVSPSVTMFGGLPSGDLDVFIKALAENQYVRVLAEPQLTALTGHEASFQVGGQFPVPSIQSGGGGGSTPTSGSTATASSGASVTIDWKDFGVLLTFRPTVLGDGRIRLEMVPEVSEPSSVNSVTENGFNIPSLTTRKADTTLELNSGQSFAMAGLIQKETQAISSRIPGLGDLPVLGALFRSVRYETDDTELVLLVTASLVEPQTSAVPQRLPGDLHTDPDDWQFYFMGELGSDRPAAVSPEDAARMQSAGLNDLRGPGAWASYSTGIAPKTAAAAPAAGTAVPATQPAAVEVPSTNNGPADASGNDGSARVDDR
jgi:pilus assembly protein CpaC